MQSRHGWFKFSIRTLLVLTVVASVFVMAAVEFYRDRVVNIHMQTLAPEFIVKADFDVDGLAERLNKVRPNFPVFHIQNNGGGGIPVMTPCAFCVTEGYEEKTIRVIYNYEQFGIELRTFQFGWPPLAVRTVASADHVLMNEVKELNQKSFDEASETVNQLVESFNN